MRQRGKLEKLRFFPNLAERAWETRHFMCRVTVLYLVSELCACMTTGKKV